ncbi:MAG TPA: serine/threonine-protein kinase, partial [Polyangia bacterium]
MPSAGPFDVGSAVQSPSGNPVASPKIGATLGRYEILAPIGHGAMATVFRARDTQLGRDVAVKVMSMVHSARGGASERFRREAHAVAALNHPGIVEIYDFVAATEQEPSYIVAELIRGPTLRKILEERGGRLLPEIAALVALPLAEALALAHERGVIHRDVKPDNVMIETGGESSRVVLTDFGVAHITGMETMTATGALVGSP